MDCMGLPGAKCDAGSGRPLCAVRSSLYGRLIGVTDDKACVMLFVLAGYSTEEVGQAFNDGGIACAQPFRCRNHCAPFAGVLQHV